METGKATVIIAQHGRSEMTLGCLRSLREAEDVLWPVIVVDDGSPARYAAAIESAGIAGVRLVRQSRRGVTAAWNAGARNAQTPLLVFLNNDVVFDGPAISRLLAPLRKGPAVVSGVRLRRETALPAAVLRELPTEQFLEGWCLAVRREDFERAGGFDEAMRTWWSDTDLQARLLLERHGQVRHRKPDCLAKAAFLASGDRPADCRLLAAAPELPLRHLGHRTACRMPDRPTQWRNDRRVFIEKWSARRLRPGAFHLLQVCNVGEITGGTAACAWTVARSLPGCRHTLAFFGDVSVETLAAFDGCGIRRLRRLTRAEVEAIDPHVVLLHNTPASRVGERWPQPTIQYLHSRIAPAAAEVTVHCSQWLAARYGADASSVLYQGVPRPPRWSSPGRAGGIRALRSDPVIGRLCTPRRAKWPVETVAFYEALARRFPQVGWEFVGCPAGMQSRLQEACRGRAVFHDASWQARSLLWTWDALLYHNPHVTESFGRTVAEAMRAGCIPIVDARGGFCEQVKDGCGFLCGETRDFEAGVEAVLSPETRWRLSRTCRNHGNSRFSLHRFRWNLLRRLDCVTSNRCSIYGESDSQQSSRRVRKT